MFFYHLLHVVRISKMYNIMIFWQVDEELWSLKGATNIQKSNKKKLWWQNLTKKHTLQLWNTPKNLASVGSEVKIRLVGSISCYNLHFLRYRIFTPISAFFKNREKVRQTNRWLTMNVFIVFVNPQRFQKCTTSLWYELFFGRYASNCTTQFFHIF